MTMAIHSAELGRRLQGVSDSTVKAVGALSEALEWAERARQARDELRAAGHTDAAARRETEVLGRNVLQGRRTS